MEDQRELHAALAAAAEAGSLLRSAGAAARTAEAKTSRHDLVTDFDRRAEALIVDRLRQVTPEHGVLSEEGARHEGVSGATWVIDPLDGTSNFVNGIPHFATSIGLVDDGAVRVGCIYDPIRDEMFAARRGRGATLNGSPIAVSGQARLDGAVLAAGLSILEERRRRTIASLADLASEVRAWRTFGSAALDLAYVACGRLDAVWYLSLHPWDVAAGRLLIAEAGGRVTALDGRPLYDPDRGILATNGRLHEALQDVVGSGSS